ncbi:MAG TPA: nitroreductase family deazaflavin-dependent oxidoreductase [Myxococcota bacterium]|nr:nitroreductase family deazaflavin-dependent oxidoreductase [Myxococcota bacterium]
MSAPDLARLGRHWNCRLTTVGRRSGEPRTVTIWFAPGPDCIYLTGGPEGPQWSRNARAQPEVQLQIGSTRLRGRARVVDDESEAAAIRRRFTERYLLARLSRWFGGYSRSVAVVVDRLAPD